MPLDPVEHLVHNSVYNDEAIFREELTRIRARMWSFVGHESEWKDVGSYRCMTVAGNPVIVVRGEDHLRAFYNVCRHRGAMVAEGDGKVARLLRCPYHWWTYDLAGNLAGVPDKSSYECNDFQTSEFGLRDIRLRNLFGLVFVTLDPQAADLEEFLGPQVLDVLRVPFEAGGEFELAESRSFNVPANWKLVAENARDGYHVPFVHPLFRSVSPPGTYVLADEGHAIQWTSIDESKLPEPLRQTGMDHTLPGLKRGQGFFLFLFPDLILMVRNNFFMISSSTPVSMRDTIVERRVLGIVGDDEDQRRTRLTAAAAFALDSYEHEDLPVLELQSRGLQNTGMPISVLARGPHATTGVQGDDNRLRQWWSAWRQYMELDFNASPAAAEELAHWVGQPSGSVSGTDW